MFTIKTAKNKGSAYEHHRFLVLKCWLPCSFCH